MLKKLLGATRGILLVLEIILLICPLMLVHWVFGYNLDRALRVRKWWCIIAMKLLGVKLEWKGSGSDVPCIYVCNHRSYFDPLATFRVIKALPVAKAELASWPLIGAGAKATGIVFVKRESSTSRKQTLGAMEQALKDGCSILIYPEGTTHDEERTIAFQKGSFKLAAKMNIPITPIAFDFKEKTDAWIGNETFIPHFFRCFGKWNTYIKIKFGEPIYSKNWEELLNKSKQWIDDELKTIRARW